MCSISVTIGLVLNFSLKGKCFKTLCFISFLGGSSYVLETTKELEHSDDKIRITSQEGFDWVYFTYTKGLFFCLIPDEMTYKMPGVVSFVTSYNWVKWVNQEFFLLF